MNLVFDQISQAAKRLPNNEALVCGQKRLSYKELESQSDSIATYLKENGIKKGDRVCLSMAKSNAYVVSILGIIKSGGVYVPIDHEYPLYRFSQIVEECEPAFVIASSSRYMELKTLLESSTHIKKTIVVADSDVDLPQLENIQPYESLLAIHRRFTRDPSIVENDLAYILYTSGSTGKPKGVMLSHGNLVAFLEWCKKEFQIIPNDRVLQTSPFTFDISGLDVYASLTQGATCVLIVDQRIINMVLNTMAKEKITFVSTVPTVVGAMVQNPRVFERYDLSNIRTFCTGSAVIPPVFLQKLANHLPQATLYNLYGPTEATIYCLYHKIDRAQLSSDTAVPIGIPFENSNAFVVDERNAETKTMAPGQLVLQGPLVAQGYYKNQAKTDEHFKNNPLAPQQKEKVYYTGDVAYRDEFGVFHFSGRNDDLVKSRGYRIELNEIEIALGGLSDVLKEFAAVALPDPLIENKLFAAIVYKQGKNMSIDDIKAFCKTKIPSYMVPDKFVVMDALPQTTSGKISRKLIKQTLLDRAP